MSSYQICWSFKKSKFLFPCVKVVIFISLISAVKLFDLLQSYTAYTKIDTAKTHTALVDQEERATLHAEQELDRLSLELPTEKKIPSFLVNYIQRHQKAKKYSFYTPSEVDNHFSQFLIWRCPRKGRCAGVGDRFRGLQFAFLLAVVTRRIFLIDWPQHPFSLSHAVLPSFLDWRPPPSIAGRKYPNLYWFSCLPPRPCTEGGHMPNDSHLPFVDQTQADINLLSDNILERLDIKKDIVISTRARPESILRLIKNPYVLNKFPELNNPDIDIERHLLNILFKPSEAVQNALQKIINPKSSEGGYTSIHVRTGYDVGEGHIRRFREINKNMSKYAQLILECALSVISDRNSKLFLASDSLSFKTVFKNLSKVHGINVFTSSEPSLHIGLGGGHYVNASLSAKFSPFINIFVDLFGIARGKTIISNGSGYARMAYNFGYSSQIIDLYTVHRDEINGKCKTRAISYLKDQRSGN